MYPVHPSSYSLSSPTLFSESEFLCLRVKTVRNFSYLKFINNVGFILNRIHHILMYIIVFNCR